MPGPAARGSPLVLYYSARSMPGSTIRRDCWRRLLSDSRQSVHSRSPVLAIPYRCQANARLLAAQAIKYA